MLWLSKGFYISTSSTGRNFEDGVVWQKSFAPREERTVVLHLCAGTTSLDSGLDMADVAVGDIPTRGYNTRKCSDTHVTPSQHQGGTTERRKEAGTRRW